MYSWKQKCKVHGSNRVGDKREAARWGAENAKELTFIITSTVAHSCTDTCSELFGSLTPNKHNRRLSQKDSAILFYRLQLLFCSSESQYHSHLHHLALQNKAEQFGIVILKSTINASNLIDFSWDQIFPKVMNPCCMLWWLTKTLVVTVNWSFMSAVLTIQIFSWRHAFA